MKNIKDSDIKEPFSRAEVAVLADRMGIDFSKEDFSLDDLHEGMKVELEHKSLTKGDASDTATIALDHLRETGDYYKKLKKVEQEAKDAFVDRKSRDEDDFDPEARALLGLDDDEDFDEAILNILSDTVIIKGAKMNPIEKMAADLAKIATQLDKKGYKKQADDIDSLALRSVGGWVDSAKEVAQGIWNAMPWSDSSGEPFLEKYRKEYGKKKDLQMLEHGVEPSNEGVKIPVGVKGIHLTGSEVILKTVTDLKIYDSRNGDMMFSRNFMIEKLLQHGLRADADVLKKAKPAELLGTMTDIGVKTGLLTDDTL